MSQTSAQKKLHKIIEICISMAVPDNEVVGENVV